MTDAAGKSFIDLTANIVSAISGNIATPASKIPNLISRSCPLCCGFRAAAPETAAEPAKPAVSLKSRSIRIIWCVWKDGKRFKSLKRHLRSRYKHEPRKQYRDKWASGDYPMVAPNYAVARSQLAKKMGLGQHVRNGANERGLRRRCRPSRASERIRSTIARRAVRALRGQVLAKANSSNMATASLPRISRGVRPE